MYHLFEYLVRGLFIGTTIGLLGLPISFLFLTVRTVDLCVGAYAVLAGAVIVWLTPQLGVTLAVLSGVTISVLISTIVGLLSLRLNGPSLDADRRDPIIVVLLTLGIAIIVESFVLTFFGTAPILLHPFDHYIDFFGLNIRPQDLLNLLCALLILITISGIFYRTRLGRAMRASAINPVGAELAGVPVYRTWLLTYVFGGLLAGVVGVLLTLSDGMLYSSGLDLTLWAFGAAIIFSLTNPLRAFAGGLVMGLIQAASTGYLSGVFATGVPLIFLFTMIAAGRVERARA